MKNHLTHLIVSVIVLLGALLGVGLAQNLSSQHVASRVVLSLTPQAIGQASGREELVISVDSDAAGPAYCGYSSSTLSRTPGTGSGFRFGPGSGRVICKYPDQVLYCISADGSIISYDESYQRTSTPTATPTVTPTVTP